MEEYVSKNEIRPYKELFAGLIKKVRTDLKKVGITFTCNLVGSAKRNLVVRHHNKGFDCDYQIFIQKNKKNYDATIIKSEFMDCFNKHIPQNYSKCKDSTSSITIKKNDNKNDKIEFSFDVVILKNYNDNVLIIRQDKENPSEKYFWNPLPEMTKHKERFALIQGNEMWNALRKTFYKKKMDQIKGKTDKKSFQLLNESVNEVLKLFND